MAALLESFITACALAVCLLFMIVHLMTRGRR